MLSHISRQYMSNDFSSHLFIITFAEMCENHCIIFIMDETEG
jgi:hypothetical protein